MRTDSSADMGAAQRVLATASRLFYANGVRAVGIEWIVAESGVAKASLYRHFQSKDELVAAFLEREDREFWQQWDGVVAAAANAKSELMVLLDWIGMRVSSDGYRGCPQINVAAALSVVSHSLVENNKHIANATYGVDYETRDEGIFTAPGGRLHHRATQCRVVARRSLPASSACHAERAGGASLFPARARMV